MMQSHLTSWNMQLFSICETAYETSKQNIYLDWEIMPEGLDGCCWSPSPESDISGWLEVCSGSESVVALSSVAVSPRPRLRSGDLERARGELEGEPSSSGSIILDGCRLAGSVAVGFSCSIQFIWNVSKFVIWKLRCPYNITTPAVIPTLKSPLYFPLNRVHKICTC